MQHESDCAVHSAPAYPVGECDCVYGLIERLNDGCDPDAHDVKTCNAHLMCLCQQAADEIERLRKDAARYQWFRNNAPTMYWSTYKDGSTHLAGIDVNRSMGFPPTELDAAIDAAMEGGE